MGGADEGRSRSVHPTLVLKEEGITLTATPAWIRLVTEMAADIPTTHVEVRGSRCRTSQDLFTEWAAGLGLPDYFGHNWDAFHDCLRDVVQGPPPRVIILREAGDLLADEPEHALGILLSILSQAAGNDAAEPRLILLIDDAPDRLSQLTQRMRKA